ncbi:wax ester/triacylglycerol synthase family O-acyltransferase [Massilia sp. G4R7]|uniref:diacylglycerol O-acyltransferase n=1 Tax=Massilia phyllostachyos TaxID=2898585 RepID=A0ABS8QD10_9BURK|nr:wax ester/triacylglycerol synthase family O-acyltransferase [Massilia phyllostachyos]MCD2519641.1 wax ester/triacylglycerol synthase family O-acyltransferase [Massilia phyllostachyos]
MAPSAVREALSAVDVAWLRMDRPSNLMMICGMLLLEGRIELQRLKEVVRTRMLCFHRFRQRVADPHGDPHWELDPGFDLDWHVRQLTPRIGTTLEDVASELASTALDPGKPMWQWHLIDGAEGCALMMRIHHCYGDGFALLHVVETMTDTDPAHPRHGGADLDGQAAQRTAWERVLGPASEVVGDALRASAAAAGAGAGLLAHPLRALAHARRGADLAYQAGVIAAMTPDSRTRLKGELGVAKRVAWGAPLPLSDVKAVAAALACSVNDVLVACIAGALRAWLLDDGTAPANRTVRALVPVNLRPPGPVTELGNRFGLVFLDLPIGVADPVERVHAVHRAMMQLKTSQQSTVALGLLAGMGLAPEFLKERLLDALAANASIVVTNVHGPEQLHYLAGRRIEHELFWVPQSGGIGIGASILSYAGQVSFGVIADIGRVPDPTDITSRFTSEFGALLLSALMMPWTTDNRLDSGA